MKILGKIPKEKFYVACSGGIDSMVLVDFLRRYPKNDFELIHFNHGTECCDEAEMFVRKFSANSGIVCHFGKIARERKIAESREEYWRNCRYEFFKRFSACPIMTAHHLNDCIETWVMTSLVGNPMVIPYRNEKFNVIRPLLCVSKFEISDWAVRHHVDFVTDRSNFDDSIKRNYVRLHMFEHIKAISPGIEKIIRKKIVKAYNDWCSI